LFENVREEDIPYFNMNGKICKPADLILVQMPAPPVSIRPTVAVSASVRNEDELTSTLAWITSLNKQIRDGISRGLPPKQLLQVWNELQWATALYYNADCPQVPLLYLKNKPKKTLNQRIKGKQGRFRQNLSGKRVDFTGRTVISPDPNCAIDEVIVPELMAKVLTFPELVFNKNIDKMRELILRGPKQHPGANFVEQHQSDGSASNKISLLFGNRKRIADELKIGDVVERHLSNGDTVLFNRQPSLHRVSIMSHKARIMPNKTLRFNECVCAPYNADFDGDEMNIHVPQTLEAKAEARTLMDTKKNLCVPKAGEPLIAATQDFLTTSYLIT
jgi:DNA-directed RNA polymerase III subunit RPC1